MADVRAHDGSLNQAARPLLDPHSPMLEQDDDGWLHAPSPAQHPPSPSRHARSTPRLASSQSTAAPENNSLGNEVARLRSEHAAMLLRMEALAAQVADASPRPRETTDDSPAARGIDVHTADVEALVAIVEQQQMLIEKLRAELAAARAPQRAWLQQQELQRATAFHVSLHHDSLPSQGLTSPPIAPSLRPSPLRAPHSAPRVPEPSSLGSSVSFTPALGTGLRAAPFSPMRHASSSRRGPTTRPHAMRSPVASPTSSARHDEPVRDRHRHRDRRRTRRSSLSPSRPLPPDPQPASQPAARPTAPQQGGGRAPPSAASPQRRRSKKKVRVRIRERSASPVSSDRGVSTSLNVMG
ncbi:uncharacterized protein AMSG_03864 [Thecamonas trahens ATCC 50062]|uniref:Uncharacterized protein n=1 Tax=Thecamonas trahens ATCC 50062 TaxID=461836 RepID=A0A0L0D5R7_THETB|nr:hypothetical protein AMSG_03864 [Thecamonas trahens ATCC 50062]KNC47431.1 hypothetical protein AMSG_03864 [Thecamonas trahens ATCC 50062]|eukprot:XP_013759767.1 hypothetical protein AMSG_03864 [Thecamonas trahens ATCC 50062]